MSPSKRSRRSTAMVDSRESSSIDDTMSDDSPPRTVLVALDLTPAGEVKIPVAEEYARALQADVLLLHVLRPGAVDPANVLPAEAVARTYLDTVCARLRGAGIHTESVLRSGTPAPVIVQ